MNGEKMATKKEIIPDASAAVKLRYSKVYGADAEFLAERVLPLLPELDQEYLCPRETPA